MEEPEKVPEQGRQTHNQHIPTDRSSVRTARRRAFPTWLDIFAIIGVFALSNLVLAFVFLKSGGGNSGITTFWVYFGTFAVTIGFALTLTKRRAGPTADMLHFSLKRFNPAMILWGLILMLAATVVIEPLIDLFPDEWYQVVEDHIATGGWATLTAVVLAPVCEEILFRGILQDSLVRKYGPVSGIMIGSAIFGLIHGIPQQVVAGFCLGIIIGFVYYKTRSLPAAIVLHGINNALATFLTLFESDERPMGDSLREMIGNDPRYWLVYAVCALLLLLSLLRVLAVIRREKRRKIAAAAENAAV